MMMISKQYQYLNIQYKKNISIYFIHHNNILTQCNITQFSIVSNLLFYVMLFILLDRLNSHNVWIITCTDIDVQSILIEQNTQNVFSIAVSITTQWILTSIARDRIFATLLGQQYSNIIRWQRWQRLEFTTQFSMFSRDISLNRCILDALSRAIEVIGLTLLSTFLT